MKTCTVYILQCKDGIYYIGITNDLKRRLWEHETGFNENCFTYKRRPVQLVFSIAFDNPKEAIAFEKQIKGWRREKKEALIRNEWEQLPELSKNYTDQIELNSKGKTDGHPEPVEGSSVLTDSEDGHFDKLNVTPSSSDPTPKKK